MRKFFRLAPNVFFLGLVSVFNDFSAEMIIAVLPAFLTITLGAPAVFLGMMEGAADVFASFWRIISGWFSDKIGKRKIPAMMGYAISVSARAFLFFASTMWGVFMIRMFDRLGKGSREAPRDALLAESVSPNDVARSFGYQRAMDMAGGIVGPFVALMILSATSSYKIIFLISSCIGLFAVLCFFFVKEKKKTRFEMRPVSPRPLSFSMKHFPRYFQTFIISVFVFGLGAMPLSLMLLKTQDIGSLAIYVPLMYFVYNFSSAIFAVPFGKLADRFGKRKIIALGFCSAIASYVVFAFFSHIVAIYLGFVLFGLYSAMTDGVERAKISRLVSYHVLAQGEGFLTAAWGISSLLAGLVGGAIWTFIGPTAAFVYGAVMMTMGLIMFIYLNGVTHGRHATIEKMPFIKSPQAS